MKTELRTLQQKLATLRGYHLLVLGNYFNLEKLTKPQLHIFGSSPHLSHEKNHTTSFVQAHYEHLPLRENSIDAAAVPYLIKSHQHLLTIFQELHYCLIGEGKLFIFGHERLHPRYWLYPQSLTGLSMMRCLEEAQFTPLNIRHFSWGQHYFIEAQKKVQVLTPVQPKWKFPVFEKAWANPAARKTSE